MTLEELISHIQHSDLEIWIEQVPRQTLVDWSVRTGTDVEYNYGLRGSVKPDAPIRGEVFNQAMEEHASDLFSLILHSDSRVCMSSGTHWSHYEQREGYLHCPACVTIRVGWFSERA
jgi:hypothetical protein